MGKFNTPRIVIDARILRGRPGGVATYTQALVEHLPRLLPHVSFVFLRHPDANGPLSAAPNVEEWPLSGDPNFPWTWLRLGPWLNQRLGSDDLFHAPYRILPTGLHARSVMTLHDAMQVVCPELVLPNPLLRPLLARYWSIAIRGSLRRADRILAVSQHSAKDATHLDSDCTQKLRVTLLGIDPVFQPIPEAEAIRRTTHILGPRLKFFLVLGGGYRNKNHVAALHAFAQAFRPSDDKHLLVVQRERTLPPEMQRMLKQTGLTNQVLMRSQVSTEALIGLYNRAEALVFPSLYEGFGLPVLEAMASGCPVICSNLTSLPEVAGDAALLCDPRDIHALTTALRRLVGDESLRQNLIERGIERAKKFTWQQTAVATLDAYREIAPWI